ncbi:hypothetical protein ACAG26_27385 [Mycobacterium sp. pUA109]|uniref:hypothetical protein n=1 Tax=Mycobacterium sp. pUA109 TaxID=3238982 RepID=UPI00351BE5A9
MRAPVEQFSTWRYQRSLRSMSKPRQGTSVPRRSAQQEIAETIKFLTWLHDTHQRATAQSTQRDVEPGRSPRMHPTAYNAIVDFDYESAYYYRPEVGRLQVLLEEVTRAKPGSPQTRFVSPDTEVVDRLASGFHHILYGRRGTGKSSLLRRIESERRASGHLVAWADQETFKGLSYPDVLVGTLAEVFSQFANQLDDNDGAVPKKRFWQRRRPNPRQLLAQQLQQAVAALIDLQRAPSESEIEWTEVSPS